MERVLRYEGYRALCASVLLVAFDDLTVWRYDNNKKKQVPDIFARESANRFFKTGGYKIWVDYLGYEHEAIEKKWNKIIAGVVVDATRRDNRCRQSEANSCEKQKKQ